MKFEDTPWTERQPNFETEYLCVYQDKYSVTNPADGHRLFIPKKDNIGDIATAFKFAIVAGEAAIASSDNDWTGYNVGINRGKVAGQTINYPHVHLILRKEGDTPNPIGGVRNVIAGKGDYTKNKTI